MTIPEHPGLQSARGALPLQRVAIRADVAGTTAHVEVTQAFVNPYDETLEVSYVFPLPELAAVTRCELVTGGRTIAARLRECGEARAAYADAIEQGQRAALVEQERQGVFTTTLGNLAPYEPALVRFAMAYPLAREDGRMVLRLPLVVADRYVPGAPLAGPGVGHGVAVDTTAVADASRISPPRLAPGAGRPALAIDVVIAHGGLPISELEANLEVAVSTTDGVTTARLRGAGDLLDRDFVLRYRLGDDTVRTQLSLAPDEAGGTFQLVVVPPVAAIRARPRDVVMLVDRSGSMDGWKIVAARRAIARMIDTLDTDDRFAVYAFGSVTIASPELACDRLQVASDYARARAIELVTGLSADGGTEMAQPIELAVELLAGGDGERDRWIVLVTDGRVANEDELVAMVSRAPGFKLLALGIDEAVNAALLGRLARATGGRVELVHDEADLEAALDRLHLLVASPALERVTLGGEHGLALDAATIVPPGPIHAFPGTPLVVRGRYRGDAGAIRVRGRRSGEPFELEVRGEPSTNLALRPCWARAQLLVLEDRVVAEPAARAALYEQIVATSLDHGVACRFTAFVAVDPERAAIAVTERHVQQPVEPSPSSPAHRPAPPIAAYSSTTVVRFAGGRVSDRALHTQSGVLRGKFAYLSPELARGLPVDARHEVFVLGTILWELVSGTRLWARDNDFETLKAIVQGTAPALARDLAALDAVIQRALAPAAADRFAGPLELAQALESVGLRIASPAEIAVWLQTAASGQLAKAGELVALIANTRVPLEGYAVVARLGIAADSDLWAAARPGPSGNLATVLRRAHGFLVAEPELVEAFLDEAAVTVPGFVHTIEAGTDARGGVFLAQDYVPGCDLRELQRTLGGALPSDIALGVIVQAARAAASVLALADPSGATVGVLLRDASPSSLRIASDGHTVWTSLGRAPSPHFTAPRRTNVALRAAPGLLDPAQAAAIAPAVSRFVVVPRRGRITRWLHRAGQFWRV